MKKQIMILGLLLLTVTVFAQEMQIDGNLRVTGEIIYSDSTRQSTAAVQAFNGLKLVYSSESWSVPENVTRIAVEIWGAGGGGGGSSNSPGGSSGWKSGGNGGSGGYIYAILVVESGEVLNIEIGTGGTGGLRNPSQPYAGLGTPGESGTRSKIVNSSNLILAEATGGGGGTPVSSYPWYQTGSVGAGISDFAIGKFVKGGNGDCLVVQGLLTPTNINYGGNGGMSSNGGSGANGFVVIRW